MNGRRGRVLRDVSRQAWSSCPDRSAREEWISKLPGIVARASCALYEAFARAERMTFTSPLLLLSLARRAGSAHVPIAVADDLHASPRVTNIELLAELIERTVPAAWVPVALLLVALAGAAVATARPAVRLFVSGPTTPPSSYSWMCPGPCRQADVEPTRLDAAAAAMRTFIDPAEHAHVWTRAVQQPTGGARPVRPTTTLIRESSLSLAEGERRLETASLRPSSSCDAR